MGDKTGIEWTDATWNPSTGCDRVSTGCDHCYAMTLAKRLKAMGAPNYQNDGSPSTSGPGFGITEHPDMLEKPLRWSRPRKIFVNSMSDLFHAAVSVEFIAEVFAVMSLAEQHTFQLLTKRHARMRVVLSDPAFPGLVQAAASERDPAHVVTYPLPNVIVGVSVENQEWADIRIRHLLDTPAAARFLSMEPLLGPVWIRSALHRDPNSWRSVGALDWVIVGGESGPGSRPMYADWARQIRDECAANSVPFLFKQWGNWRPLEGNECAQVGDEGPASGQMYRNVGKKAAGRILDGRTHDGYPNLRLRNDRPTS